MFEGQAYQMEKNDAEGPNAIHGFLRKTIWDVEQAGPSEAAFTTALAADAHPGYPFALAVRVTYRLDDEGLTCSFAIGNVGDKTAPVAAGFHPYFTVGSGLIDADTLHVPMASYLEFQDMIPTGRVLPVDDSPLDFRQPRPIGGVPINNCYLGPSPRLGRPGSHSAVRRAGASLAHRLDGRGIRLRRAVFRRPIARRPPPPRPRH